MISPKTVPTLLRFSSRRRKKAVRESPRRIPKPERIQRKRSKGFNLQAASPNGLPVIYVGRPTGWGNPWRVGLKACGCRSVGECMHNLFNCATAEEAAQSFRKWVETAPRLQARAITKLRGKNLACWCLLSRPCHADILLEIANR